MKKEHFVKLYENIDFIKEKKLDSSRQSLWHAIEAEHFVEAMESNRLQPHTSHRYWKDGKHYKDNHELYEDSFWKYGWSTTRKKEYAFSWKSVVLELDADEISKNFKIQPLSWGSLMAGNRGLKREFEDFIISHHEPRTIKEIKIMCQENQDKIEELYNELYDNRDLSDKDRDAIKERLKEKEKTLPTDWLKEWSKPRGRSMVLDKVLKGIYIEKYIYEKYLEEPNGYYKDIEKIIAHPLFKGCYEREQDKKKTLKIK